MYDVRNLRSEKGSVSKTTIKWQVSEILFMLSAYKMLTHAVCEFHFLKTLSRIITCDHTVPIKVRMQGQANSSLCSLHGCYKISEGQRPQIGERKG